MRVRMSKQDKEIFILKNFGQDALDKFRVGEYLFCIDCQKVFDKDQFYNNNTSYCKTCHNTRNYTSIKNNGYNNKQNSTLYLDSLHNITDDILTEDFSVVYFIADESNVKIGITENIFTISTRLRNMQANCPNRLFVVGMIQTKDAYNLEQEIHDIFSDFKKHGEWFNFSDDIKRYVATKCFNIDINNPYFSNYKYTLHTFENIQDE